MLAALGRLLKTLVRQNRGFDRVGRCSGQSFLLFLGDTSARNALSGAERIRQSVEATSFRVGEAVVELTASYGVAELGKSETPAEFLKRLKQLVAEAKRAGRNRTCLDEGQGPQVLELPQYKVQGRVIDIASPSPDAASRARLTDPSASSSTSGGNACQTGEVLFRRGRLEPLLPAEQGEHSGFEHGADLGDERAAGREAIGRLRDQPRNHFIASRSRDERRARFVVPDVRWSLFELAPRSGTAGC